MSDTCCDAPPPALPDCQTALKQAANAYHQLMVGSAVAVKVKANDTEIEYERRNLPALLAYIKSMYAVCPCPEVAAILGLGRRSVMQPVYGPTPGYGPRRGCC